MKSTDHTKCHSETSCMICCNHILKAEVGTNLEMLLCEVGHRPSECSMCLKPIVITLLCVSSELNMWVWKPRVEGVVWFTIALSDLLGHASFLSS